MRQVRFFLAPRYFQPHETANGMTRDRCLVLLDRSFGVFGWSNLMRSHSDGFWIKCRMDQFASFIIERHRDGNCINGIRDLNPQYVDPLEEYQNIADDVNKKPGIHLTASEVKAVCEWLGVEFSEDKTRTMRNKVWTEVNVTELSKCET